MLQGSGILYCKSEYLSMVLSFFILISFRAKWIMESMGPGGERKSAKARNGDILKRLGHKDLKLTEYEGVF